MPGPGLYLKSPDLLYYLLVEAKVSGHCRCPHIPAANKAEIIRGLPFI